MVCPKCSKENPQGVIECWKCGYQFEENRSFYQYEIPPQMGAKIAISIIYGIVVAAILDIIAVALFDQWGFMVVIFGPAYFVQLFLGNYLTKLIIFMIINTIYYGGFTIWMVYDSDNRANIFLYLLIINFMLGMTDYFLIILNYTTIEF